MQSISFCCVLALLLSLSPVLYSQTAIHSSGEKAATSCKWVGTIVATTYRHGETEFLSGTVIYSFDTLMDSDVWYKLTGGNFTWSTSGTNFGDCIVTGGPYNFDVGDSLNGGSLIIGSDNLYGGGGYFDKLSSPHELAHYVCSTPPRSFTLAPTLQGFFIGSRGIDTVTGDGFISGSIDSSNLPYDSYSYHWDLHMESGETKLSVESSEYDSWLPTAGKNERDPGKRIAFRANLVEADGTTACAIADSFKFELVNVSHEPGVACNFPDASKAENDWDLHFLQELNSPTDVMSSDRLSLRTKGGSVALAVIPSFDWGAYGTLKVSAILHGGTVITGFLKGHPEITQIPLPKRASGSKIADKWKKDAGVESLADGDDGEGDPVGDGDPGDGFTLYEEYRGFYENGEHVFGDPLKKDLFVYSSSDDFLVGLQLFAALTHLNVHDKLNSSEFDTRKQKRILNFNHTDGPHQNDQHGLWLRPSDHGGASYATSLGPPKLVDTVNISPDSYAPAEFTEGNAKEITNELSATIAHELGHAVHIKHHGDLDQKKNVYTEQHIIDTVAWTFETVIYENGTLEVDLRSENGDSYDEEFIGPKYIGIWGGEHSGFEDCIMRYDVSEAYIAGPGTSGNIRYVTNANERTGIMLCDKKEDDAAGVNFSGRDPRPRYGDAVNGRCRFQICVNDKFH